MTTQSKHPPILSIVGFAVMGLFSFGLLCALLLVRPELLASDAARGPALAVTHLTTLGWISSLLFAGTYLVGPLLAGGPLWSRRLPAVHFCCHFLGLGLLIGGSAVLNYQVASAGGAFLILGFFTLLLNVYQTGSQRSLWTPANLAFHSAIFWLIVTGAMALLMFHVRLGGTLPMDTQTLIALHAHYGLFGFLAQVLLAVSLRIVPEMFGQTAQGNSSDRLSWFGWGMLNGGLFLLIPASQPGWTWPLFAAGLIVAAGIVCFTVRIALTLWQHRHRVSWSELTHATGILLLLGIVVGAVATYPLAATGAQDLRAWMSLYISLVLLGPFAFAILGVGQRFIPRLIWHLRLAPWANLGHVQSIDSLSRPAAGGPTYFSLLLAFGYLAYGQWMADTEATRLGAVLMLIAIGWFIAGVRPAILRFVVAVTPEDLRPPPTKDEIARALTESVPVEPPARKPVPALKLQPLRYG